MRQIFALTAISALVAHVSPLEAKAAAIGVVNGTVHGTNGVLAGVTVQVLDARGTVTAAVTTASGGFSITGLTAGRFTIQAVAANGAVIGSSTATLAAGAMVATVTVNAAAAALAATAGAAVGGAAGVASATAPTLTTTAVVEAVGTVFTGLDVIHPPEDLSGSN